MKKYIIVFTLLFILFACGDVKEKINNISNEKIENDLTKSNLKGKVKEVIEKEYSIKEAFGETVKDELKRINDKLEFNLKGNITQRTVYDRDFNMTHYYIFEYNSKGDNIKHSYYDKEGNLGWYNVSIYERKGIRKEAKSYNSTDSVLWQSLFEYDTDDQLIKVTAYNIMQNSNNLPYFYEYQYDKAGNQISVTHNQESLDKGTEIITMEKRKFDVNGNIIQSITYNGEGKETYRYTNVYNEDGLRIQYDSQSTSNKRKSTYSYTNNRFEFDDRGNWIKHIRYIDYGDNTLDTILLERTYTYY